MNHKLKAENIPMGIWCLGHRAWLCPTRYSCRSNPNVPDLTLTLTLTHAGPYINAVDPTLTRWTLAYPNPLPALTLTCLRTV